MVGYSLGEYVAACLSDVFTLTDAMALVCARGNLMRKVDKGAMLAVGMTEADAAGWLTPWLRAWVPPVSLSTCRMAACQPALYI